MLDSFLRDRETRREEVHHGGPQASQALRRGVQAPDRAVYDNGKKMSELEAEYDLSHSTVARWVKAIHENGSTRAADNRTPEQQRILDLERENRQLRMEVDVLKQAALIFARK